MRLSVLIDNNTVLSGQTEYKDRYFLAEPGLSFFIETEEKRILFDTGHTKAVIENAEKMHIDLSVLDYLVLSHGHGDHTGGLPSLLAYSSPSESKPILVAHPFCFLSRVDAPWGEIGCPVSQETLSLHYEIKLSKEPLWLTEDLVFLGEIPRQNDFENLVPLGQIFYNGKRTADYLWDDSALAYRSSEGLVIITGCSHAGICNIVQYAQQVCREQRIVDIIGGFHLIHCPPLPMKKTVAFLQSLSPGRVRACHCTGLLDKLALAEGLPLEEVGSGMQFYYA